MATLPRRIYASVTPATPAGFGRVTKSIQTPEALLTYPVPDLQGDIVDPAGMDWTPFNTVYERLVNLEHGPYIGTAEVEYKSVPRLNKTGTPDESLGLIDLPFGVTTFFKSVNDARNHTLRKFDAHGNQIGVYSADECYRYAEQTAPLVLDGTLSGVSLEFRPKGSEGTAYKSLGPSPMLKRDAFHFIRTEILNYAGACAHPVNQYAGYSPADAQTLAKAEKALRLCERSDTLELVRKSLRPLANLLKTPSGRVTAAVRRDPVSKVATRPGRTVKADGEYMEPVDDLNPDAATEGQHDEPDGDEMKPTPAALLQFAQALRDACTMADDMGSRGEHVQGVKALKKFCEQVEAIADKVAAMGDKVAAAVDTGGDVEMDTESDVEPVETDDDGMIEVKAFSSTKWRPQRLTKANPYTLKHTAKAKKSIPAGQVTVDQDHLKHLEKLAKIGMQTLGITEQ